MRNYSKEEPMKILLITEKFNPDESQRDGGSRLINTLKKNFGESLKILQFAHTTGLDGKGIFKYPSKLIDRFERRIANADFIAQKIKEVMHEATHIIFVHISMQFGIKKLQLPSHIQILTFPMFLTPSYKASGENVPVEYTQKEQEALAHSHKILTPSYFERSQLIDFYKVPEERIYVVPRGVETTLLKPKMRQLKGYLRICSIGSIKPQKNTLELIRMFSQIKDQFNNAKLKIIGPIQNVNYHEKVMLEINALKLTDSIELSGYIMPSEIAAAVEDQHLHISLANCETFGRSIFETLALGLPNIAYKTNNAAAEFLENKPYIRFVEQPNEIIPVLTKIINNLSQLSEMAQEIGMLYNDDFLAQLLVARIKNEESLIVSDFDGTLFHKTDSQKTLRCVEKFKNSNKKILCSARAIPDLIEQLKRYDLEVDWIVGLSGAIVTNGKGAVLWKSPLDLETLNRLKKYFKHMKKIKVNGKVLQVVVPSGKIPEALLLKSRVETYQNTNFISHWQASKLHAIYKLLRYIHWRGQVQVYGDGIYDTEILRFFDGIRISQGAYDNGRFKEEW